MDCTNENRLSRHCGVRRWLFASVMLLGVCGPLMVPGSAAARLWMQRGENGSSEKPVSVEVMGRISAVTTYGNWASVTRLASVELAPGQHQVVFRNLPEAIEPGSIRANAGSLAVVTSVNFRIQPDEAAFTARLGEFDATLAELQRERSMSEEQLKVFSKEEGLLDAIADGTAQRTSEQIGTGKVDLEEVSRVSQYLAQQHADLLQRRRGVTDEIARLDGEIAATQKARGVFASAGPDQRRSCLLSIEVPTGSDSLTQIQLTYLVGGVRSRVAYSVRTNPDLSTSRVEYDLLVEQHSGEDWNDVTLVYSTAPIIDPTAPPSFSQPIVSSSGGSDDDTTAMNVRGRTPDEPLVSGRSGLARLVGQAPETAPAGSAGPIPITSFRALTAATVMSRGGEPARLRLATVTARPVFRYVAAPVISSQAYLRGTVKNETALHWLPGPVSLFLGSEYVGESTLPHVGPGDRVDLFFGTDPRITAHRYIDNERTRTTGLLGDGAETTINYRLEITNESSSTARIEVWDRVPIARDDRYSLSTSSVTPGMSKDRFFQTRQRKQGLMRWDVELGPGQGDATTADLTYTLSIRYKSDVDPPDIPR